MPKKVLYGAIGFLIIGILPMPYSYYTFLRIVVTGVFIWATLIAFDRDLDSLKWFFIALAILFNPIIKISFTKEIWLIIDIAAAIFLFFIKGKIQENIPIE